MARAEIVKAFVKHEAQAAAKTTARRIIRPKVYSRIVPDGAGGFTGKSGKRQDSFTRVEINGKTIMERDDGATFALKKNGTWSLVGRPRRKTGPLTPWVAGGTAAAASGIAGYELGRQSGRK